MIRNEYEPGVPVAIPGHLVGRTVQAYDDVGRLHAGIVLGARYDEAGEELYADVALVSDQSVPHRGIESKLALILIQRGLRLTSDQNPQPNTFSLPS